MNKTNDEIVKKNYKESKISSSKSVDKINKKSKENTEKFELKLYDDTRFIKKASNKFLLDESNESQENQNTSFSKNLKELNISEAIENEVPHLILISKENTMEFLVKKKKNLPIYK